MDVKSHDEDHPLLVIASRRTQTCICRTPTPLWYSNHFDPALLFIWEAQRTMLQYFWSIHIVSGTMKRLGRDCVSTVMELLSTHIQYWITSNVSYETPTPKFVTFHSVTTIPSSAHECNKNIFSSFSNARVQCLATIFTSRTTRASTLDPAGSALSYTRRLALLSGVVHLDPFICQYSHSSAISWVFHGL